MRPIRIFTAYSHADEDLRDALGAHLRILEREGQAVIWHDRRIPAGHNIDQAIDDELELADIVLLLISADFVASDYCWGVEMARAMEKHQNNQARVIPVILRRCVWEDAPFGRLRATPTDGKPVRPGDQDEALTVVARDVQDAVRSSLAAAEVALSGVDGTERYSPTSLTALRMNSFVRHGVNPPMTLVLFVPDHGFLGISFVVWACAFGPDGGPMVGLPVAFEAWGADFGYPSDVVTSDQGIAVTKVYPKENIVTIRVSSSGFEPQVARSHTTRIYDPKRDR